MVTYRYIRPTNNARSNFSWKHIWNHCLSWHRGELQAPKQNLIMGSEAPQDELGIELPFDFHPESIGSSGVRNQLLVRSPALKTWFTQHLSEVQGNYCTRIKGVIVCRSRRKIKITTVCWPTHGSETLWVWIKVVLRLSRETEPINLCI